MSPCPYTLLRWLRTGPYYVLPCATPFFTFPMSPHRLSCTVVLLYSGVTVQYWYCTGHVCVLQQSTNLPRLQTNNLFLTRTGMRWLHRLPTTPTTPCTPRCTAWLPCGLAGLLGTAWELGTPLCSFVAHADKLVRQGQGHQFMPREFTEGTPIQATRYSSLFGTDTWDDVFSSSVPDTDSTELIDHDHLRHLAESRPVLVVGSSIDGHIPPRVDTSSQHSSRLECFAHRMGTRATAVLMEGADHTCRYTIWRRTGGACQWCQAPPRAAL